MIRSIFSFIQLLGWGLLGLLIAACEPPTTTVIMEEDLIYGNRSASSPVQIQQGIAKQESFFAVYKEYLTDYDSLIYFENWSYDAESNNINCNNQAHEAILEAFNYRLGLGFDKYIAKENKKTLHYTAVSPFANLEKSGVYNHAPPLQLNDKLFSGVLVGTHTQTGERLIEARFYQGVRIGEFKIWNNLGRLHQRSLGRNNVIIMDESVVRKPAIYLYPTKIQDIQVALDFKCELTHSYPKYPRHGWQIRAQPDGSLIDLQTGKEYGYLFGEGESAYHYQTKTGFVVEGATTAYFLDDKKAILGLNRAEATDFITYWLPELERNSYNLIYFSEADYQDQTSLSIQPKPETHIRVFMVYQPLTVPVVVEEQQLNTV